jgi:hypothetical protein
LKLFTNKRTKSHDLHWVESSLKQNKLNLNDLFKILISE